MYWERQTWSDSRKPLCSPSERVDEFCILKCNFNAGKNCELSLINHSSEDTHDYIPWKFCVRKRACCKSSYFQFKISFYFLVSLLSKELIIISKVLRVFREEEKPLPLMGSVHSPWPLMVEEAYVVEENTLGFHCQLRCWGTSRRNWQVSLLFSVWSKWACLNTQTPLVSVRVEWGPKLFETLPQCREGLVFLRIS